MHTLFIRAMRLEPKERMQVTLTILRAQRALAHPWEVVCQMLQLKTRCDFTKKHRNVRRI